MSMNQADLARELHRSRQAEVEALRRARTASAVRRLERRADRLSHRAERATRSAARAASRARLAVARVG